MINEVLSLPKVSGCLSLTASKLAEIRKMNINMLVN